LPEIAEAVPADHVAVVGRERYRDFLGAPGIHIEVIVPEAHENLAQLPAAVHRAQDGGCHHFLARPAPLRAVHVLAFLDQRPSGLDRLLQIGDRPELVDRGPFRIRRIFDS